MLTAEQESVCQINSHARPPRSVFYCPRFQGRLRQRHGFASGHAAPILYCAWAEAGLFSEEHLMTLRKIDSELEGHPVPSRQTFVDVATGSLGQGLSCACGMAYTGKHFDKASYRVFCVLGDGESAEGSVWEAMHFASYYKLDNLVAIFDINRLGQSQPTSLQHDMETYKKRAEAFGWNTIVVDGHDVEELCRAFFEAENTKGSPTCILARTFKGKGFPGVENLENFHGKPMGDRADGIISHIQSQISSPKHDLRPGIVVDDAPAIEDAPIKLAQPPNYHLGDKVATRNAYGTGLVKIGRSCDRVIALDCDVKNSTFSISFMKEFPDRFIECFIAEQNMVGVAVGCGTRGRTIPFASTFACFLSRGYDQIRMAGISHSSVNFCGSHVGCSIGEDGASQMALEDLAMFRAIPLCSVFYPSDAVSCERAVELASNTKSMTYIRSSRPATPVIYNNDETFEIGKAKIVRQSESDQLLVVGGGITLHEALKAAEELSKEGIHIRVMDLFTVKPIDQQALIEHATAVGGKILTVEDHYYEGGIGEAVCSAVAEKGSIRVHRLAVPRVPQSGPPDDLLNMFGISASCIVKSVKNM
ncbi:hypothetical protein QZH41_004687 [Actinostola sp. cb2023]|nr:hypothetical protein QZH41_004687 [Actinostola sp. cb2023]